MRRESKLLKDAPALVCYQRTAGVYKFRLLQQNLSYQIVFKTYFIYSFIKVFVKLLYTANEETKSSLNSRTKTNEMS